eukprot:TRINITY_DN27_c0_g1_i2.p3 TRINITY_DN27_c0_g1~~TRINITY_DN27_c0_g1_i2.p3  ORF type:complete len:188 (+),score=43.63 TRINITY_DN27_c0_g1_i2:328-891(+)
MLTRCVNDRARAQKLSRAAAFRQSPPARTSAKAPAMSLFAATARAARGRTNLALRSSQRALGDTVRGPQSMDLGAHLKYARDFFSKEAVSYMEYKQQCVSLRLFAVPCVIGACVALLFSNPPKSSYWRRYSPTFLFQNVGGIFLPSSSPLFLAGKAEREADVPDIVSQLVTTRRIAGAGSDSEEEDH